MIQLSKESGIELTVGNDKFKYERLEGWAKIPEGFSLGNPESGIPSGPAGVAVDSNDRVFVFCRGNHPILIFNRDGNLVSYWGEDHFVGPHGIFIGPDDSIYLTDYQCHTVEKFTPTGKLLMRLGIRNVGMPAFLRTPFCMPTNAALGVSGEIFVTDGYAGFVVHKFSPQGTLLKTWGEWGHNPGQFAWPHGIGVDRYGTVYICDRENDRIQLFTTDGEFITMWTDFRNPHNLHIDQKNDIIYVVESQVLALSHQTDRSRISILDLKGNTLSMWEGRESEGKGVLETCHDICVDSHGDIYVAEIVDVDRIQKFVKIS